MQKTPFGIFNESTSVPCLSSPPRRHPSNLHRPKISRKRLFPQRSVIKGNEAVAGLSGLHDLGLHPEINIPAAASPVGFPRQNVYQITGSHSCRRDLGGEFV
ncbi:hypothetical protein B7494_g8065 [Chlorociboria aeruginascens]|nr:hypothetical protein B7494_g8065 [Chlorociboria aeruginascens]